MMPSHNKNTGGNRIEVEHTETYAILREKNPGESTIASTQQ